MDNLTFEKFRKLIHAHSGIHLSDGKESLVSGRIAKRIRDLELSSEMSYFDYIEADQTIDELTHLIDLISTNVTQFLREPDHFDLITETLMQAWRHGPVPLKIWSAACSSGQEPYTLAMVVHEAALRAKVDPKLVKILATDISTQILKKAIDGVYSRRELEHVPADWVSKYFQIRSTDNSYQVTDKLRSLITFRRLNLAKPPFPMAGPLDVILCRNVMIYFDNVVRKGICDEASRLLSADGLFLIGHSENLSGITTPFRLVRPTVYKKKT